MNRILKDFVLFQTLMILFIPLALVWRRHAARTLEVATTTWFHFELSHASFFSFSFSFLTSNIFSLFLCFSDYMVEKLGIDESKIPNMCDLLYKNYGTTMAGLRVGFMIFYVFKSWFRLGQFLKPCF